MYLFRNRFCPRLLPRERRFYKSIIFLFLKNSRFFWMKDTPIPPMSFSLTLTT